MADTDESKVYKEADAEKEDSKSTISSESAKKQVQILERKTVGEIFKDRLQQWKVEIIKDMAISD